MPVYLHQIAYSREGWQALLAQPQDRIEAVRPAIEKLGGKIRNAWFAFGEYDIVLISEMPDNASAAAISIDEQMVPARFGNDVKNRLFLLLSTRLSTAL